MSLIAFVLVLLTTGAQSLFTCDTLTAQIGRAVEDMWNNPKGGQAYFAMYAPKYEMTWGAMQFNEKTLPALVQQVKPLMKSVKMYNLDCWLATDNSWAFVDNALYEVYANGKSGWMRQKVIMYFNENVKVSRATVIDNPDDTEHFMRTSGLGELMAKEDL
jgi:hypothetical protein